MTFAINWGFQGVHIMRAYELGSMVGLLIRGKLPNRGSYFSATSGLPGKSLEDRDCALCPSSCSSQQHLGYSSVAGSSVDI